MKRKRRSFMRHETGERDEELVIWGHGVSWSHKKLGLYYATASAKRKTYYVSDTPGILSIHHRLLKDGTWECPRLCEEAVFESKKLAVAFGKAYAEGSREDRTSVELSKGKKCVAICDVDVGCYKITVVDSSDSKASVICRPRYVAKFFDDTNAARMLVDAYKKAYEEV